MADPTNYEGETEADGKFDLGKELKKWIVQLLREEIRPSPGRAAKGKKSCEDFQLGHHLRMH